MPAAATHRRPRAPRPAAVSERVARSTPRAGADRLAGLEHLPIAIFESDTHGACRFVNARWCEHAGLSQEAALGDGWTAAIHPDDRDGVVAAWRACVRDGREFQLEYRFQRPDGTTTWVAGRAASLRGAEGRIAGYVGAVIDITEAVKARQQLVSERQYVDTVIDTAGSLVCVLDPDGRIIRFNRACEVLTGYDFEEIRGRPIYDFLLPEDEIDSVKTALGLVRPGEPPAASENRWVTKDGALRLVSWLDTCFFDDAGALTHIVSTGLDITEERRAEEVVSRIESIANLLATTGPTPSTLAEVLSVLAERTGYRFLALFLWDEACLSLRARLGYGPLPTTVDPDAGMIGRALRTGQASLVADAGAEFHDLQGHPEIASQIAVPLSAEGLPLGVLIVASTADAPLSALDVRLTQRVGNRLAVALVLGRGQQLLADRARLFGALSGFGRTANSILEEEPLILALVGAAAKVLPADVVALTVLDRETGRYLLRGLIGTHIDPAAVGGEIILGEGATGRAIATRAIVVDRLDRARYPKAIRAHAADESLATLAIPLMREGVVLGAILVGRATERDPGFTELEREVLTLLGTQAALALANAHLLTEVRELSIRDHLTGLYNRRHFDAVLEHILARWTRERENRKPVAAIMFDLDRFGQFNKDHGHEAGDAVLRAFSGILQTRFRSADLVARYGGEEFVAILEGATRDQAVAAAEEVRRDLAGRRIRGPDGLELHATVSAGCAEIDAIAPTREGLLRTADVGLFMAKRNGRNQVVAA
jgi:diguanylate cyclase (GGDEF)-like protein/PAS domain S-box-containing protein